MLETASVRNCCVRREETQPPRPIVRVIDPMLRISDSLSLTRWTAFGAPRNRTLHVSQSFSGTRRTATLVSTFVTCPDEVVAEIQQAIDAAVNEAAVQQGYAIRTTWRLTSKRDTTPSRKGWCLPDWDRRSKLVKGHWEASARVTGFCKKFQEPEPGIRSPEAPEAPLIDGTELELYEVSHRCTYWRATLASRKKALIASSRLS